MSAPEYVPHGIFDKPRRGEPLPAPGQWWADRPGEVDGLQPRSAKLGSPGPDQGYALKLLRLFTERLVLNGEDIHDVEAGAIAVALKRASLFGRAPLVHDLEVAFRVWGFLDQAPPDLVSTRKAFFSGAGHSYRLRRAIADATPEETLRMPPAEVADLHRAGWRTLLAL